MSEHPPSKTPFFPVKSAGKLGGKTPEKLDSARFRRKRAAFRQNIYFQLCRVSVLQRLIPAGADFSQAENRPSGAIYCASRTQQAATESYRRLDYAARDSVQAMCVPLQWQFHARRLRICKFQHLVQEPQVDEVNQMLYCLIYAGTFRICSLP